MTATDDRRFAVVTGAGRGLGRQIALDVAAAGLPVFGIARSTGQLEETAALVRRSGGVFEHAAADVTCPEDVAAAFHDAEQRLGTPSVVVNNAGLCLKGEVDGVDGRAYAEMIAANTTGVVLCTRAAWPSMRTHGGGVLVNISSLSTVYLTRGFAVYAASKAFVESFTQATAQEGRRLGIRCYALSVGYMRTELLARTSPEVDPAQAIAPVDVSTLVVEMTSPRYRLSSGSIVRVAP